MNSRQLESVKSPPWCRVQLDPSRVSVWEPLETSLSSNRLGHQSANGAAINAYRTGESRPSNVVGSTCTLYLGFLSSVVASSRERFDVEPITPFERTSRAIRLIAAINPAHSWRHAVTTRARPIDIGVITENASRRDATSEMRTIGWWNSPAKLRA